MARFAICVIVALGILAGMSEAPLFAKASRSAAHSHRYRVQRAHHHGHHRHKVHPKNPTRRHKAHRPRHPAKARPRPTLGHRPKSSPPRRTVPPKSKGAPAVAKPAKVPARAPVREVQRFVNFNDRTGEYWFDNRWWYNYVVYPTTVSRSTAFTANYRTMTAPANITVKPPVITAKQALPIAPAGSSLAVLLDRMDVEHRWLPGTSVGWRTGEALDGSARGPASNAGAFVAAVCAELKVPMPPATGDHLLPAFQHEWLVSDGPKKGWVEVGALEAQLLANQGWVVIAAWKDAGSGRSVAAQTAIVRPNRKPAEEIAPNGPRVVTAGVNNYNDVALKDGFPPKAWTSRQVVYLAHRPG